MSRELTPLQLATFARMFGFTDYLRKANAANVTSTDAPISWDDVNAKIERMAQKLEALGAARGQKMRLTRMLKAFDIQTREGWDSLERYTELLKSKERRVLNVPEPSPQKPPADILDKVRNAWVADRWEGIENLAAANG